MHAIKCVKQLLLSALIILVGALIGCSPVQVPNTIATSTIIPSSATHTPNPIPTNTVILPSATSIPIATQATPSINTILETNIAIDYDFTQLILTDLANSLDLGINRLQVVSVEENQWDASTLGCTAILTYDVGFATELAVVDGLEYKILVGLNIYTYHTEGTTSFIRCPQQTIVNGEVLVRVDPLANETLRVVQTELSVTLDIPSRRVQLVDMIPIIWEDTSLGCPQDNQTYSRIDIPGYHIVVSVGNDIYVYHSDSNTAYPCSLEQSIIPIPTGETGSDE